jgi:hypothetical protein
MDGVFVGSILPSVFRHLGKVPVDMTRITPPPFAGMDALGADLMVEVVSIHAVLTNDLSGRFVFEIRNRCIDRAGLTWMVMKRRTMGNRIRFLNRFIELELDQFVQYPSNDGVNNVRAY